ncbi:uncharacterized protein LOC131531278 isoform X3 [Onychostoma macrolepis]|uniref:uncharacterized protein LOC131531278 isoform X3 n=1 Tax=Onychostoma macrolepis TaxID=369639 RepID=UPI00272AAB27|nr:uncharacterized protein LOC131531278 isoform X3 [Onychostoma macrolepis]
MLLFQAFDQRGVDLWAFVNFREQDFKFFGHDMVMGQLIKDLKDLELRQMVEFICAPAISSGQIAYLKNDVYNFGRGNTKGHFQSAAWSS